MSEKQWGLVCNRVDSCALSGAAAFFAGIPGAEILANGPLWCYYYALRSLEYAQIDIADRFHGSQPDNHAVVYGTEDCLTEAIRRLINSGHNPSLLFVENSCSISLIGDDLNGILSRMDLPFPYVAMDCGGLMGGFAEGWQKAFMTLLQNLKIGKMEPAPLTVNLLGLTDFYYNGEADRIEIVRILKNAGYTVNTVPGAGSSVDQLQQIGKACLNIVFHEELGLKMAEYLQEVFGIPFIAAGIPYGMDGTLKWLKTIHQVLPAPSLDVVVKEISDRQLYLTARCNDVRALWGALKFPQILVAAPGTQALCLAETLRREWVDTETMVVICQHPVAGTYCTAADYIYTVGRDDREIGNVMDTLDDLLVVASSSENSRLMRRKRKFTACTVALPVREEILMTHEPFVGIKGSAHMLQRLWNGLIQSRQTSSNAFTT
ncbi:MAG: hypothetical protein IJ657_02205 [Acidaminococcaceae bacterium]|nr:hypothetical protein [Acidaminococcaceae bacterium]